jgi:hypothetical protein
VRAAQQHGWGCKIQQISRFGYGSGSIRASKRGYHTNRFFPNSFYAPTAIIALKKITGFSSPGVKEHFFYHNTMIFSLVLIFNFFTVDFNHARE